LAGEKAAIEVEEARLLREWGVQWEEICGWVGKFTDVVREAPSYGAKMHRSFAALRMTVRQAWGTGETLLLVRRREYGYGRNSRRG